MTLSEDQIATTCTCGNSFRVKGKAEGRKVRCPKCNTPVLIQRAPGSDNSEAPALSENAIDAAGNGEDEFLEFIENTLDNAEEAPSSPHALTGNSNESVSRTSSSPASLPWLTNLLLGLLVLVGGFIALLLASQSLGVTETTTKAARTKWEYQIVTPFDELLESKLQSLGNDGWELVNARRASSQYGSPKYEMIFRRPKHDGG